MTGLADMASIVTAGATCVALVFAGSELRRPRAHDVRKCQVETEGVAVSWAPTEVPRAAQDEEGVACWVYEFTTCTLGRCQSAMCEWRSCSRRRCSASSTTGIVMTLPTGWCW
jgi:hypothetical protein